MSRDVLTVGSTMRIPLLYQREYSQWVERFMNYLEEQTDGEAMINSIKNGDQPLPRVTQVSIARTSSNEQTPLKDKFMWSDQEKKIQKIDCLARSLLIQGLSNDIYSLIDSNKIAKDLSDALARHMLGSEYGEQDRKAAVLYEYETFKATEGKLLLDTYIRYLQVINDFKKCGYSKDNYVNDAMGLKKKNDVVTSDPLALIAKKTKVNKSKEKVVVSSDSKGSGADDFSELKKITALLAKAFNRRNSDSDQEINVNMVFMAQIEKVLSESNESSSSAEETIAEIDEQEVLYDKISVQLVELDKHVRDLKNTVLEKDYKISELEECVRNKDLEIEKCLERLNVCENKLYKMGQTNQTIHMIMLSKDILYNGRKGIGFENLRYFEKAKDLRPSLYDEKVIGLGLCDSFDENNLFIFDDESIVQICLWIIDSGCSKHMTGNHALLTNFVEKFLGTVCFGNNDFAVIAGYGDVDLEVAFRKSACFVRNEYGVDLLTDDRSSNLYTIALNEVASNSSTCLLQRLLLRNLGCGINIHESVNVNFDEISEMASKQFSLEPDLSNLNETGKSLNPSVSQVSETSKKDLEDLFHNFYDECFDSSKIMKSSTTNVESSNVEIPSNEEEVFHESFESFQKESASSSLNDDVQQSSEEVGVPSSNTQLISNSMIPNVDEASTSHNVFNKRLEDAYFDA
nr:integrase, catalytic region, zinc finger, CCHC-type, peptidase aspartic, catalytic [Tanacetum cinerariifolium]